MLLGEILLIGIPFGIGIVVFYLLGRYLSAVKLFVLLALLPVALFSAVSFILPSPSGSAEVALQFIIMACVLLGAITGGLIGFAVRKYKNNKQHE